MTTTHAPSPTGSRPLRTATTPRIDLVIPTHNEAAVLDTHVRRLRAYLDAHVPWPTRITIADNASTDDTPDIARRLAASCAGVRAVCLSEKGRGQALAAVWGESDADVVAYMDVDLSTDLSAFSALVAPVLSGHSDLAIGTRLARGSRVVRGTTREVISRGYNLLLHTALRLHASDAQCGFKAARADVARALLARIENGNWFFDTELLVLAERSGARIHEVPVDWVDDPDTRVHLGPTIREDLAGIARMLRARRGGRDHVLLPGGRRAPDRRGRLARQLWTFGAIGVVSTIAYLVLYTGLRAALPALAANALALVCTAIANTAANARLTFGARGGRRVLRDQIGGGIIFALALACTSGALALLSALAPEASRAAELGVLLAASAAATVARFVLLRLWITRRRIARAPSPAHAPTAAPTGEPMTATRASAASKPPAAAA